MKKISLSMAGLFFALVITNTANAQMMNSESSEKFAAASGHSAKAVIESRIMRRFLKDFPGAVNDAWAKTQTGYLVSFTEDGFNQRAFLDKKGHCTGSIRYYGEKELLKEVRHLVKSNYYDYAITAVKEVTCNRTMAFLVTIEDATTWKVIRVVNGEMDEFEKYTKANAVDKVQEKQQALR